jgi:phosphinothricin acetyltransferase
MELPLNIRLVTEADYAGMLEVYKPNVLNTAITFEYEVPSLEEYSKRIDNIISHYPCFVCVQNGVIAGFAYAGLFRVKDAYQWSAESTIYVSENFQGKGIARVLYDVLLSTLELQGFVNVYAAVTLPNLPSEKLHTFMGFAEIGLFEKIGFKHGKWHDLKWYEMYLTEHPKNPTPPVSIYEVKETVGFLDILTRANESLNRASE